MNLKQGTLLKHGEYRIERELGHGGFGITYLAVQLGLNRRVAIKEFFMREYCNRDAETSHVSVPSEGSKELVARFRAKFIKEAQNIACLKHPHIISIYDVFEDNGTAYYVMEYHDYGSLTDLVKRQGRLPEADALRYIRQIADALRYIHERKMNHLDVKPGNILIDETDHAVLIDFGLSKRYDDEGKQTSTTPVGISHGYAPLEQYKKSGIGTFSPATDIYSLGATLYKLVTGTTPPDANDINDDGLPALPSCVSSTTATAIEYAMQPRRKDRPQSVDAFLALLDVEVKSYEDTELEGESPSASPDRKSMSEGDKVKEENVPVIVEEDTASEQIKSTVPSSSGNSDVESTPVLEQAEHSALMETEPRSLSVREKQASASQPSDRWDKGEKQRSPREDSRARRNVAERRATERKESDVPGKQLFWKKLLWPAVACVVAALVILLWPEEGNTSGSVAPDISNDSTISQPLAVGDTAAVMPATASGSLQPAPVKEEPAAPTTTSLYVTTTPSGAAVYVDGKKVGATPIEDKEIARGIHKVKLSKEGYEDKTFTRTFGDEPVKLNVTLHEKPKSQSLQSSSSGSSVTTSSHQNDTSLIQTVLQQQSQQQQSQQQQQQQSVPVASATTSLYVNTTPSGATVYVDGKKIGTTPIEDKEIARGIHKVKLSKDGYEDKTFTRTFGDKPVMLKETLAEKPKSQHSSSSSIVTSGTKKTYKVRGVSFTMVRVAGGTFTMGSSDSDADSDERPAHQVTLDSYFIGETEVTQALWQAVMGSNPSHFTGNLQRPVENVSWNDCQAFIRKLNSLTGATFRLPTEAEWEYAARGGSRSRGYTYCGSNSLGSVAWYSGNSADATHRVKGKQPNELGLYDMAGNVWEWCADRFGDYSSSSQINPKGASSGSHRVLRGASWNSFTRYCRVAYRGDNTPGSKSDFIGLRLAQ